MGDMMTFPASVEEFMEQYKMTDTEHVYSNGAEYVPIYRMKQWFEHCRHQMNMYDQCEIIEGCTVEILTNTLTGETSVGWWRGGVADRPGMEEDDHA